MITFLNQRRQKLTTQIDRAILLWSGKSQSRNFPNNTYPFRASSHFLYFAGINLENAILCLESGRTILFWDQPPESSALWHGEAPSLEEFAHSIGADAYYPKNELHRYKDSVTIAVPSVMAEQTQVYNAPPATDRELALGIVACRLTQDDDALAEIRQSARVTIEAHLAGMKAACPSRTCAQVRAQIEAVIMSHNCTTAYNSIVTTQGQILHSETYHHALNPGDLLLVDAGAESPAGWATDVTRTYPVRGKFSATQKLIYEIVLEAQIKAIEAIRPGVEYEKIHLIASLVLAEGLVAIGILKGNPADLLSQHITSVFFPHGIGHLLGLDVHDMEDLGDLAGYAPGRQRSTAPGLKYLRLHRPLEAGMVVTIEPGFYQVPHLLKDPYYQPFINWEKLAQFQDVKGIRIEDDVLVTATGSTVLTASIPKQIWEIEATMASSK